MLAHPSSSNPQSFMHKLSPSSASSITLQDDAPGCGCISALDESTVLLSHPNQNLLESQVSEPAKMTPVPKLQLAIICLVRLLEPIGFTQLFPYINEMMIKLDILDDPSKVGFVSGLVVSEDCPRRPQPTPHPVIGRRAFSLPFSWYLFTIGQKSRMLSADVRSSFLVLVAWVS